MAPTLHLSIPVDDLDAARTFYVDVLGCEPGRVRTDWIDVWFFGMQLTLQLRPDEVRPVEEQGTRHFGVALDADEFRAVVDRIDRHDATWLSRPTDHTAPELSQKTAGKLADPAGNVLEIKHYPPTTDFRPPPSKPPGHRAG